MIQDILSDIGYFSDTDITLFEKYTTKKTCNKNDFLLKEGEVCQSVFYILSSSFSQFQSGAVVENIVDLHLQKEWMFNHQSFINQSPSKTAIKAFIKSEVIELSLGMLHSLIAKSQAFLQFGKIFNQADNRIYLFDNCLNPAQKYNCIKKAKPLISQMFPVKMIASYLKVAPETLSRVKANY